MAVHATRWYVRDMRTSELELLVEARSLARTGRGRELREAAGLTQGEIARAAGVNFATVSRWESGGRKPSGKAALRWARVMRVLALRV